MDNWNPLTDTVPIHSWIHPWLPLLQSRLEPLYPPIRSKLANALQRWHPSDTSARLILQPWKDVFSPGAWEAFMVKNILPKLGTTWAGPLGHGVTMDGSGGGGGGGGAWVCTV